jgi:hemolysin III
MANTHTFTRKEEIGNSASHGVGVLLSIAALVILIVNASMEGSAIKIVSFTIYGVTMLLLYLASTLFHGFRDGKVKNLFEIFDHSAIYLYIAGTYTPILLCVIEGALGWTLFGVVWGIAIVGILFKVFFVKRFLYTSTLLYVLMGWIIVFAWRVLFHNMDMNGIVLLIIGGLVYTIGAVFYVWDKIPYHHMIWHFLVLLASVIHFFAILFYI